MSDLTVFQFEGQEVRFVGTPEDPWWVAVDVCNILEHSNSRMAIDRLDEDEKRLLTPEEATVSNIYASLAYNLERNQSVWLINESGLYSLILTSRKPQAKRFKKWVTSEVLPSIRKTGKYEIQKPELQLDDKPTIKQISDIFDLSLTNLDPNLVAEAKLKAIASYHPQLSQAVQIAANTLLNAKASAPARQILSVPEPLMSPTELAAELNEAEGVKTWTARRINRMLLHQGFQIKNPRGNNPSYLITEKGQRYGRVIVVQSSMQYVRWFESVLTALGAW